MNGSAHMGFNAGDRIKLGWANVQDVNINSISGTQTFTLRDAAIVSSSETDVIRLKNGTADGCGDIIIEARQRTFLNLDSAPGVGNGDGGDFYLPNEGLLISKAPNTSCGGTYMRYSGIPNGGEIGRRNHFGSDAHHPDGMYKPAFGPGDQLTPFSITPYSFRELAVLDDNVAITNIAKAGSSFNFTIWSNFPSQLTTKQLTTKYSFDDETLAQNSSMQWTVDGVLELEGDTDMSYGPTLNFGSGGQLVLKADLDANGATFDASGSAWLGIIVQEATSNASFTNVDITSVGGGAGGAALTASNGASVTIDDSFIDVNAGSYVYGIKAAGGANNASIKVTSSAIRSASAPAVYASGTGKSIYLYDTHVIQNSSSQALYASNSAIIESRIPSIYYVGLNKVKGGKTYAQGSAVITFGGQHNLNHYCNTASSSLQTTSGGVIYAGGNYWYNGVAPTTSGSNIYTSPLQGTADCSDVVYRVIADGDSPSDPTHTLAMQSSLDNPLAQLLQATTHRQQGQWNQAVDLLKGILQQHDGDLAHAALLELGLIYKEHREPSYKQLMEATLMERKAALEPTALRVLANMYILDEDWSHAIPVLERIQASFPGQSSAFFADLSLASIYVTLKDEANLEKVLQRIAPTTEEEERVLQTALYDMNRSGEMISGADEARSKPQRRIQEQSTIEGFSIQAYPNPFNPSTTFTYMVPHQTRVVLKIYDSLGRDVRTLVNGPVAAGEHTVSFEASALPSGTYVYRLEAGELVQTGTIQLVK